MSHSHTNNNKPIVSFLSGGMAGVIAKSAVAPLERVKILYQK